MRPLHFLIVAVFLTACAKDAPAPGTDTRRQPEPAAPPSDPADEVLELTSIATVPPPTLLDPPVENTTASGLRTITYATGNGRTASAGDLVAVHYTGWLQDTSAADGKGNKFDSSIDRREPITFALGRGKVIKGWDEGLDGMREGGKRTLIIPPDLAYGSKGAGGGLIPPDATLIFDVELVSVSGQ